MLNTSFINDNVQIIKLKDNTVKFFKSEYKFIINEVEVFTVSDLLNYILNGENNDIIEKYICIKKNDNIVLHDISILTGCLEILIHIYNGLYEKEVTILNDKKLHYIQFMIIYLNYLFKFIIYLNNIVIDSEIKYKLLNHSIIIIHKLLQYSHKLNDHDLQNNLIATKKKLIAKLENGNEIDNHYLSEDT